ncbi:MAG: response regulator transcription factor [Eubacterium sp.]|nr:response regulator transcription factor [Eubacterium sp.]SEF94408.1 DNA-binding response regulator, OmpR family, contains REC and winged-helix (wHTH) domain [Eubacterium ruminantium]
MGQRIYAADDEQDILDVLEGFLTNAGYEVSTFPNGDLLYEAFRKSPADLVILDVMMPGHDGLTICRMLREISDVPIIILTARESESDHMRGLILGGDDYLIKPFSPSLLVVRVNALLRRVQMSSTAKANQTYGDITFSATLHTAYCRSESLDLSVTEFSLLGCLMEHPGVAVSRDELLSSVWGIDTDDIETRVTDETVRRIRQKLKKLNSSVQISAVWGYGYKLEDKNEAQ